MSVSSACMEKYMTMKSKSYDKLSNVNLSSKECKMKLAKLRNEYDGSLQEKLDLLIELASYLAYKGASSVKKGTVI
jgi:hypothetical protein